MNSSGSILLNEKLVPSRINLDLQSADREEVLGELVRLIPELADQPEARQTLLRALQDREKLYSTGIGYGIAQPQTHKTQVGLVDHALVVFGRHSTGIAYGAPDGLPARLLFLVVATTVTQHLAILARLIRLLRDPTLRQGLLSADDPEKAIALVREAEQKM